MKDASKVNCYPARAGEGCATRRFLPAVGRMLCAILLGLGGVSNAYAQWGQSGATDPLLEQLDLYTGGSVGKWIYERKNEETSESFEAAGGTVFAGVQLTELISVEQRFAFGGSDSIGDTEIELQGVWTTAFRLTLPLTRWGNQFYAIAGISGYHVIVNKDGVESDDVDIANYSAGLGLTHRVSENAWLYVERFHFDGIDGDFSMEISGGAMYRF